MKAIVKKEPREGVWMEEVPMPEIGAYDLLIKIQKTSICGTDLHLYKWDEWAQTALPLPAIIGHEFVGIVAEVGANVTDFSKGERVSGEGHLTCGQCYVCRTGQRVLCPKTIGLGYNCDGCFAEYFALPAENAFKIPDEISDEVASILDPLGNAVHTALSYDLVGKDVLITGAGPIGLMTIPIVRMAGARRIVITDINPNRLKLAERFKPDAIIDVSTDDVRKVMSKLSITDGFDVCLEMSGSPTALASLPDLAGHGGKIVLLGILPSDAPIDWHQVIFKMLTIKGIYGREIFHTWYQVQHMIQGGMDITPVITHRFSALDFQKGFDVMLAGSSGKVILDWSNI